MTTWTFIARPPTCLPDDDLRRGIRVPGLVLREGGREREGERAEAAHEHECADDELAGRTERARRAEREADGPEGAHRLEQQAPERLRGLRGEEQEREGEQQDRNNTPLNSIQNYI